jgi:hypothetical protein
MLKGWHLPTASNPPYGSSDPLKEKKTTSAHNNSTGFHRGASIAGPNKA